MNKKQLVGALLGGGLVITATCLGGFELDKKNKYNQKIAHFGKVAKIFKTKAPSQLKDHYIPPWDNEALWKKHYEHHAKDKELGSGSENFKASYKNHEEFKNFCYERAEKEDYGQCTDNAGWCAICPRDEKWSR